MIELDIQQVDALMDFCREEAKGLREKYGSKYWAEAKAIKLDQISTLLGRLRQDQQMRGPGGERIDR